MNIIEAVKRGTNMKRRHWPWCDALGPGSALRLTHEDVLADDWEVEEEKLEITRTQFEAAFKYADSHAYGLQAIVSDSGPLNTMWNKLKELSK